MKMKTLLAAAAMCFVFSAAAFAQSTYTVGSTPVTQVVKSGQTEKTGDISFTHVVGSGLSVDGTITITYGVPITVTIASPPTGQITVTGTGDYAAGTLPSVNSPASSNSSGVLVINVPAGKAGGSIRVSGVRVAVAGTTLTSLSAGLSSTGNQITAGQTSVAVINSIAPGLSAIAVEPSGGILINSVSGACSNCTTATPSTIRITEGFLNAFGVTSSADPTQTISTMVKVTLSSPPPAGVTLSFPNLASTAASPSGGGGVAGAFKLADCVTGAFSSSGADFTSASTALAVCYRVFVNTNVTLLERLEIPVTAATSSSAALPIPSATISVTATLAPIGPAFDTDGSVLAGPIPRYAEEPIGPAGLASVVGANTTLLIPFATTVTAAGYNTGIAISNSTKDPGKSAMGVSTAIPQTGTVTFYFYPQVPATGSAPAPFNYTTKAGSPGVGLDSAGNLPSGSTYSVLLSQLLAAAGQPADYTGYIFVITNFTNAHCLYVATNFAGFAQGAMALVITGNRDGATESLDN